MIQWMMIMLTKVDLASDSPMCKLFLETCYAIEKCMTAVNLSSFIPNLRLQPLQANCCNECVDLVRRKDPVSNVYSTKSVGFAVSVGMADRLAVHFSGVCIHLYEIS